MNIATTEREQMIDEITDQIAEKFLTFGGKKNNPQSNNPIDHALAGGPPKFALGVDVRQVVQKTVELTIEKILKI